LNKLERIEGCQGEALQDNFVLSILDFKKKGYYVELGAAEPVKFNNTYILEKEYNWDGVSFDIDLNFYNKFKKTRRNEILLEDAVKFDYKTYLDLHCENKRLDFLQCDIDPTEASFYAMVNVLASGYSFNIIMFEHNIYLDPQNAGYQDKAYQLLKGLGYVRYAKNVKVVSKVKDSSGTWDAFEDWYVHGDLGLGEDVFVNQRFTNIFNMSLLDKIVEELKSYSRKFYFYQSLFSK